MVEISAMKSLFLLSLILALNSCSAPSAVVKTSDPNINITDRSVVSIIEPTIINDKDGVPHSMGYSTTCNAFAVQDIDVPYLVTAAHCVKGMGPGSRFRYLSANGIGSEWATLEWVGLTGDRAIATIDDSNLIPFKVNSSYYPEPGDVTISVSSVYSDVSKGTVIGPLIDGWFDTTQNVTYGWSGSPVLNQYGQAWGIVSMCRLTEGEQNCDPDYSIVSSIY